VKTRRFAKPDPATWNLCGVLVQTAPTRMDEVADALAALAGVEVHRRQPDGRVLITIEDTATDSAGATLTRIAGLPGVADAALVYHHAEPKPQVSEESPS